MPKHKKAKPQAKHDKEPRLSTRGIPSRVCVACGGDTFKVLVRLDEDNKIGWWTLSGYCARPDCGTAVTLPCPHTEDAHADD